MTRISDRYAGGLVMLGTTVDHMAFSPEIGVRDLGTSSKFGSDHVPVVADLTISPAGK